jgi:N-acetyl-gamma-glutamyl-phosphate reductase
MNKQPNVCIVGASGYSGIELVRLINNHPHVKLAAVTSRSLAGELVEESIPYLRNQLNGLVFEKSSPEELAARDELDLFILALPHGAASEYVKPLFEAGKQVIDLSADFRLSSTETYKEFYGEEHPCPELLSKANYFIPELSDPKEIISSKIIACPGCYPTSIITALYPLLEKKLISEKHIVINSCSGVSGAGKKLAENFIYCERNESAVAYSIPFHRHLSEIEEQLSKVASNKIVVQFNPHLAPMKRGILSTITVPSSSTTKELTNMLEAFYKDRPFIKILDPKTFPDSKYVVGTNRVDISVRTDPRTGNAIITSSIDNLLKGASGQAVQLMNIALNFEETAGLL